MDEPAGLSQRQRDIEASQKRLNRITGIRDLTDRMSLLRGTGASDHVKGDQILEEANAILNDERYIHDVRVGLGGCDFVEAAMKVCSESLGGTVRIEDTIGAFDYYYMQFANKPNYVDDPKRALFDAALPFRRLFRSAPEFSIMNTAIFDVYDKVTKRNNPDQTTQSQRKRRSTAEEEEEEEEEDPQRKKPTEERDLETKNAENALAARLQAAFPAHCGRLHFWRIVYGPTKGATFMNMFHLTHLLISDQGKHFILCDQDSMVPGQPPELVVCSVELLNIQHVAQAIPKDARSITSPLMLSDEKYAELRLLYGDEDPDELY